MAGRGQCALQSCRQVAKTKNRELDRREHFEVFAGLHQLFEVTSASEIFFDCFTQRLKAGAFKQHPNFERAKTPGKLRPVIPKRKSFVSFLSNDPGILCFVGEGGASCLWIAIQDAAAINWKIKPFVGIERERISFLDRGEQRARRWSQRGKPAVSTINMQPKIEAPRDFADLWKRIESAGRYRSSVGHYANRQMSRSAIFFNRGHEFIEINLVTFIHPDQAHVVASDAEQCGSLGDGMVRFFGSINTQRSTAGLRPFVLNFRRRFGASCGGERSHIRHRSATDKKSSGVAVKADDLFDPFDG